MTTVSRKQAKVRDHVADAIRRGELRPGQRLENDRDLSVQLGVSRVTLGRGLNMLVEQGLLVRKVGSGTYVAETAEASSAEGRRGGLAVPDKVGFVISASASPVALALQQGMHQVFPKSKCDIVVKDPEGDPEEEMKLVRDLVDRGTEALVVATCAHFLDAGFRGFYRGVAAQVPLVMCDCALYDPAFNVVSADNVLGGAMAAEFLAGRVAGRGRTFWVLRHSYPHSSLWERTMGFQHCLAELGADKVEVVALAAEHGRAVDILLERFRVGPAPDGIFALSDIPLNFLVEAAPRAGLELGQLNLCCFDNFLKTAGLFKVPYLEQDLARIGGEAARVIAAALACPDGGARNVRIPPRWVGADKMDNHA